MSAVTSGVADVEVLGFVGRSVLLPVGERFGLDTAARVDARDVLNSPLFQQLTPADRQLVVELAAR